jgi:hypothetical protein
MDKIIIKKCVRCNGALTYDKFYSSYGNFWGWKCLNCGDIIDPVILNNRQMMLAGQEKSFHRVKRY